MIVFHDRQDAAHQLADRLKKLRLIAPLVLAIPRGGLAIGGVLASELNGELDVALTRKLRAPRSPEFAIGAVSEDGTTFLNENMAYVPGISMNYIQREEDHQRKEIARLKSVYRDIRLPAVIEGRSVIVTDDGIATGSTMIAALRVVRSQKPQHLIVAVPVINPDVVQAITKVCSQLIFLQAPANFRSVGQFYEKFDPVTEEQALEILFNHEKPVSTKFSFTT
jgi:putative phosphoribosyl transferase